MGRSRDRDSLQAVIGEVYFGNILIGFLLLFCFFAFCFFCFKFGLSCLIGIF